MTKWEVEEYKKNILNALIKTDPLKIILFGSIASGLFTEDSDFDMVIILNIPDLPNNYEEKLAMKLTIRKALGDLSFKIPIDLIVYTIPEYEEIKKMNTSFYQELVKTGEVLYEKAG